MKSCAAYDNKIKVKKLEIRGGFAHSRIGHYFFSYLLTCEEYLIEVLGIMAQMRQYILFLSLKPIKVISDFISDCFSANIQPKLNKLWKTVTKQ